MPYVFNNPDYLRSLEVLYKTTGGEYTGTPLDPDLDTSATPILPGMVATLFNGVVTLADTATAGGAFKGLFYSEVSSQLDELNNKDLAPVMITGPALVKVLSAALDSGSTYAVDPSNVVELVAGTGAATGRLVPRASQTTPTVAHLEQVLSDGIIVALMPEDSGVV